jgi:hypothetical protein
MEGMTRMEFDSQFEHVAQAPEPEPAVLREEPNLFRMSVADALEAGGPVTRSFIEHLPADWRDDPAVEIRSKLAWLRRGWYPGQVIGDWHVDLVPQRPDGLGQDYAGADEMVRGCQTIACVFGDVSLTEYVVGRFELPDYPPGQPQQLLYDRHIERLIAAGRIERRQAAPGQLLRFGFGGFHRVAAAHAEGWRMIFRAVRGWDYAGPRRGDLWQVCNHYFRPETPEALMLYQPYMEGA